VTARRRDVSGARDRVAAFFLEPARQAPSRRAAIPPAARVAVLGATHEVAAVAAATALGLRGEAGAAVVALWRGDVSRPGVATRAASRLAATLTARELPAVARGRLAWLALPDDPDAAARAVRRASALVAGPFVTGVAGPRPPALELLIAEHDIAVVAAHPETPLARAALTTLADHGITALATAPLQRGAARTLALAGITARPMRIEPPPLEAVESRPDTISGTAPRRHSESIWSDP
jgi:hypothetical protein